MLLQRALLVVMALCAAGCTTVTRLSPPEMKAYEVSLASGDGHLAMAWHGTLPGIHDAIFLRQLDSDGTPAGPPLQLTDGRQRAYEPSLQMLGKEAIVGWYERSDDGRLQAFVARFSTQGKALWRVALSPAGVDGRNPVVRVGAGGIHVAWLQQDIAADDGAIRSNDARVDYARLDADGKWREPPREIGSAGRDTWNLNAALDDADAFYLVYDARGRGEAKELQMVRVHAGLARHALLSSDDGHDSTYPDLAIQNGRAALTWFDERDGNQEVYLYAGTVDSLWSPVDGSARRITDTPGHSIGAYVAWNRNLIGLAWCDDSSGEHRVFEQQFDAQGQASRPAQALTDGRLQGLIPAILPWGDGFAVAWNERRADKSAHGHAGTISSFSALRLVGPAGRTR